MKQENGDKAKQANGEEGGKLNQLWVVVGGIAGLIAIVMFLTGKDSIPELLGKAQETSTVEPSPEPTSTLIPTPTPMPTPEYILQDDFSDPTSGWTVSTDGISERKYRDGEYIMRVGPGVSGSGVSENSEIWRTCYESWSLAGLGSLSDIAIEVDARYLGGAADYGAYGIIFYYQDKSHFYYDQFYPNWGMWERAERDPSGYYNVISPQDAPDMRVGQSTNHIRLEISKMLKLYINGELVSVSALPYQAGEVGFWAESCTGEILEVAFDNVAISNLP